MTLTSRCLALFAIFLLPLGQAWGGPMLVPSPPSVKATSYLLIDYDSGQVLADKDADMRVEPASLTKMMTAYVVLHELKAGTIKESDEVTVSEKAWRTPGSRMFIEVGKKVPVGTLFKGMVIQSGNDASVALAEYIAGSEETFAELMNEQARRLGLNNTHFVNATGLPHEDHYTTAADLARIATALIREFPEHYGLYSEKQFTYNNITQYNRNKLLWRDKSVDGIKTGHTESAGYCLVTSAKRNGMRLISVVLGTDSENARAKISQSLLNYGFRFFETHKLYEAGQPITRARVWKGEQDQLPLGLGQDFYVTIPRGQYRKLKPVMELAARITAPVSRGQTLGTVAVTLADQTLASRPLLALDTVAEAGLWGRLVDGVQLMFE